MADDETSVATQADSDKQSPADTHDNDSQAESAPETISLDEARKLRAEAKSLRTRLKDAETKLTNYDNEKLSETQKLQNQVDELTADRGKFEEGLKSTLLKNKVAELKDSFGLRSTKAIARLIEPDSLEFDLEKFDVSGVEDELKRLKKEDPDLFISGGTDGGKGNDDRGRSFNMNDQIRRAAGRM